MNQEFVKRFYPKDDPIGKHFGIDLPQYSGAFEIVGVFHDFKMNNPRSEPRPVFLRPLAQYYNVQELAGRRNAAIVSGCDRGRRNAIDVY